MSYQPHSHDPRRQGYGQTTDQVPYEDQVHGAAHETTRSSNVDGMRVENQHESYRDPMGNQVDSRVEVFEDKNQSRATIRYWIASVTSFVFGVLEALLLLRFFFRLLGANQANDFIAFLYGLSHGFVSPFNGIFNDHMLGSFGVFEVSTLIAMIVYALVAWGIIALGRVLFAPNFTGRQSITTTRRSRSS